MKTITNEMITDFKEHLQNEEKSSATVEKYIYDVKCFKKRNEECELTKSAVLEYKSNLIETYKTASVNSMLSSLNSFFDFMGWHDLKVKNVKVQKQMFLAEEKLLTKCEYDRLLSVAQRNGNQRLYLLMQCICATGIRVSELRFITVESLSCGKAEITNKGKRRIVFLPGKLCKMLSKYAKKCKIKSGSVFVSRNGKPLNRSNIWASMKKLCESAKVPASKVFPHNLRHLFARTFYTIQKDIVRLSDILGHSSINTTRIYTKETGEIHRMQIQHLGLLRC